MSGGLPGLAGTDHVGFTMPDIEAATRFFVDVIGCSLVFEIGPFQSDDDWMPVQLGVDPRSVIRDRCDRRTHSRAPACLGVNHPSCLQSGDEHRQRRRFSLAPLWGKIAVALGVKAAPYPGYAQPLEQRMADAGPIWDRIVAKYGLQPNEVDRLASWWHTDAALGRTLETLTDMTKS